MASKREDDTCHCVMDTDKLNEIRSQRRFAQITVTFVMMLMCGVTIAMLVINGKLSDSLDACRTQMIGKLRIEDLAANNIN